MYVHQAIVDGFISSARRKKMLARLVCAIDVFFAQMSYYAKKIRNPYHASFFVTNQTSGYRGNARGNIEIRNDLYQNMTSVISLTLILFFLISPSYKAQREGKLILFLKVNWFCLSVNNFCTYA